MKGTDVTDAQLIHAWQFLQRAKDPSTQTWPGDTVAIHIPDLVRLLAWYGAIRARSGRNSPAPLIQRCTCANPGADLMTTVCDCGTPTTTRCDCHATEHDFYDPRLEGEPNTKSLYDIPSGCICLGDGLMGMECTATEHARLRDERPAGSTGYPDYEATDPAYSGVEAESVAVSQAEKAALHIQPNDSTPELKDPRDERIRELVIALNEAHANFIKEYWATRAAESRRDELQFRFDAILGSEITARRKKQDDIWGGPEHDDAHKPDDSEQPEEKECSINQNALMTTKSPTKN